MLLRVDGGLKSGWDVVMAAAMGAEEFGFGKYDKRIVYVMGSDKC